MRFFSPIITFTSIVLFTSAVHAQNSAAILGKVVDAGNSQPIEFASISLLKPDNQAVKAGQTNTLGVFKLDNLPAGTYMLRAGFVGYSQYERLSIVLKAGQQLNLGTILLKTSEDNVLQEVVIEGAPPAMQMGIDRKVFNVAQSLVSAGGTAADLLGNIPSLQVDMDGAVSLRGSGARILIDGRPSALAGNDVGAFLQSLPANSIDRVEVITNPSSKYDPEGQSGIINIILKKNVRNGLNGSVNASAGNYNNYNGGLTMGFKDKRFNYYGNYNIRRNNRPGSSANHTLYYDGNGLIDNTSENSRKGFGHQGKLGLDYYADDKTTIGVSGNLSTRTNDRGEDLYYTYQNLAAPVGNSNRYTKQNEDEFGYELNLDLTHDFSHKGENLLANFSYGHEKEDGNKTFNQDFTDPTQVGENRNNDTREKTRNYNIQLDYTRPFSDDSKLEAGYRTSIRKENNYQFSNLFDADAGLFLPDYHQSNNFSMEDIVHAVYANYQNKLTKTLGFQVGLRAEQAYLNTLYASLDPGTDPANINTKGRLNYFRIYPSVYLTQQFNDKEQLQLSYSRRVSRPDGWQVNPFQDLSDNYNIRQGNPNLKPEDTHSVEMSYAYFWQKFTLTSSIYARFVNDVIQLVTSRAEAANNQTFSQWQNLSKSQNTGFEFIGKWNMMPGTDVTGNFNLFYKNLDGAAEYDVDGTHGTSWDANINANVKLAKSLTAQIRADYKAPQVMSQGKTFAMKGADVALKWDILNTKGSLMLNVRNVFDSRKFGGTKFTNQFVQDFEFSWMRRMANLTFTYRFGREDFQKKKPRKDNDTNQGDEPGEGF
ncbi:Outer membrane receptor proteins, mostly Fe transport [bacterium A37T11]|nr:Outer membrane receptor proteins, mostly Fe transport [bacterium A37T11]